MATATDFGLSAPDKPMQARIPNDHVPNAVKNFIQRIVYMPDEYGYVMTAILGISHDPNAFNAVPHALATAKTKATGKSTLMCDVPLMLAHNPEKVGRTTTEPALASLYQQAKTNISLVVDDTGKTFGEDGLKGLTTKLYAILIDAYRNNASQKMSRNNISRDVPTYGVAFMNGLFNAVPDDLFSRSILFEMKAAPEAIAGDLMDALDSNTRADAEVLRESLHNWTASRRGEFRDFMKSGVKRIHPKLVSRTRQIWGPCFAFAAAAGGEWPRKMYDAFLMMGLSASDKPKLTPDQFTLLDTAEMIMKAGTEAIFTSDIVAGLRLLPQGDYYREIDEEHFVKRLLPGTFGAARQIRARKLYGEHAGRAGKALGYDAAMILMRAAELRQQLQPPMEDEGPDETDLALAFAPDPVRSKR